MFKYTPHVVRMIIVVEQYIKDLEDGDTLMDMMSANASYERTTQKRGENIFPEVNNPPSRRTKDSTIRLHEYKLEFNPKRYIQAF